MINKNFENIKIEDITQLIENGVPESKTIEYKLELNDDNADSKKEFLADLSSFANSEGGDLIYGLRCENGVPIEIIGIDVDNIDQKLLQLENIIRDGLSPRIIFNIKYIELNSKYLFIFRVSKSWSKPHRIEYKNYHRFYGRNTAGKYLLDINELRNNFLSTNDIVTNIKNFITNRNTEILSNNGIAKLNDGCKLAIYLIPLNSFVSNQTFDLFKVKDIFCPPSQYNWEFRTNLEGFLKYTISDENITSYVQLYRNGIIEAVLTNTFLDKE
ncbi:AlbA family DNA-binding domain-containing protein, partial [Leptospira vanthielii]